MRALRSTINYSNLIQYHSVHMLMDVAILIYTTCAIVSKRQRSFILIDHSKRIAIYILSKYLVGALPSYSYFFAKLHCKFVKLVNKYKVTVMAAECLFCIYAVCLFVWYISPKDILANFEAYFMFDSLGILRST